jgi:hypothetical protein
LGLTTVGNFTLGVASNQQTSVGTSSYPNALFSFEIPNTLRLVVKSIIFEKNVDRLLVHIGGEIRPLLPALSGSPITIERITIDDRGHVSINGGWLNLPSNKTLNFFATSHQD